MTFGFDYASVDGNKPPHWPDVLAAGASFVWVRASFTYWDASHKAWACVSDPAFVRDWGTIPKGLVRGAYMFPVLEASQTPEEQVAVFAKTVRDHGGLLAHTDFPPCLDIEFPGGIAKTGLDRAGVLAWLRRAVTALKKEFGVPPFLYTSGRVWNDTDADCLGNPAAPDLIDCPLWLARYPYKTRIPAILPPPSNLAAPPVPTPWGDANWWLHQWQGDALGVPGFTSTVDVDRFRSAKPGDRGGHIVWMKRRIMTLPAPQVGPLDQKSDLFDDDLVAAVEKIQGDLGLVVDANVGLITFCAIAWL